MYILPGKGMTMDEIQNRNLAQATTVIGTTRIMTGTKKITVGAIAEMAAVIKGVEMGAVITITEMILMCFRA